jgi:hypothetical protein
VYCYESDSETCDLLKCGVGMIVKLGSDVLSLIFLCASACPIFLRPLFSLVGFAGMNVVMD